MCVDWQQQRGAETSYIVWGEKWNKAAAHVEDLGTETFAEMVRQKWRH